MTVPGSVVSGRWRHFQGGMPRPVVHAPVPWLHPHVKTVPQSETCRNVKCKGENGIASSNLTETQYKSSVANKLVDIWPWKICIAKSLLLLCFIYILQFFFFICKTYFFLTILHFLLQFIIFVYTTYFLLAILHFLLQFFIFVYKKYIIFSQYFHFRLQNFILFCNTSILLQIYAALFWLHSKYFKENHYWSKCGYLLWIVTKLTSIKLM